MIIDVHTHLNNYHEEKVISIEQCLDEMQVSLQRNQVDYALVLTSYKVTEHRPSTAAVVKAIEKHPNLGVVAGISLLNYKERDLREIADFLKDGLVKGLKIYPGYEPFYPHDQRCKVLYDLAAEFQVPVMNPHRRHLRPDGQGAFRSPPSRGRRSRRPPGCEVRDLPHR